MIELIKNVSEIKIKKKYKKQSDYFGRHSVPYSLEYAVVKFRDPQRTLRCSGPPQWWAGLRGSE